MTKTLIFLLIFAVTVTGMSRYSLNAEEKSVLKFTGYDWSNSSPSFKFGFVFGWLYGGKEATDYTAITAVALLRDQKSRNETDSKKFLESASQLRKRTLVFKGIDLGGFTFDQIIATIDNIYKDPRTKLWDISEIMPFVRGRLKAGWAEKELDEVIAYKVKHDELTKRLLSGSSEEHSKLLMNLEKQKPKVLERYLQSIDE